MTYPRRLSMLVHGNSGVGKTPFVNTAPGPRLMIDSEGASQWLRNPVVQWDPRSQKPNEFDLTDDTTVVVRANDYATVELAYQWLASGEHPFRSVIIDSLTELQEKVKKSITNGPFEQNHWGELLEKMAGLILNYKDLVDHPVHPVDCVIFTTGSAFNKEVGKRTAYVQGQLLIKLPYKVAVVGYLGRTPEDVPYLLIQPVGEYDAKDRTIFLSEHYGSTIMADPGTKKLDIAQMMTILNPEVFDENIAS